jgi:hypothetical protein
VEGSYNSTSRLHSNTRASLTAPKDWSRARHLETILRPLAAQASLSEVAVRLASKRMGIGRAYCYRLLAAYKLCPQTSTLLPRRNGLATGRWSSAAFKAPIFRSTNLRSVHLFIERESTIVIALFLRRSERVKRSCFVWKLSVPLSLPAAVRDDQGRLQPDQAELDLLGSERTEAERNPHR